MSPRIAIVGGGSYQWVPKLIVDVANTPSLVESEIVLHDIDPAPLPRMAQWVEHVADRRGIPLTVRTTTDRREALAGADHVVVTISTGGFASMRHDLEIPRRYGIAQSVGDTVGPGGITRALRNIPVFLAIAADMAELCPDAWLLNITNPMTTICRAVTRETGIRAIGLCHELTILQFFLMLLLDADFGALELEVTGVNHLPIVTRCTVGGADGFELLRALLADPARASERLAMDVPDGLGFTKPSPGPHWTRGDLIAGNRLKFELFRRFGALPAAGDRHLAEFFPGVLTEASHWGGRWGVHLTTIAERERHQGQHLEALERMFAAAEISRMPSGELVAATIDSLRGGTVRHLPLNIPNAGQCPDLAEAAVVESICTVDAGGVRGRDRAVAPPVFAEQLRRIVAAQELTVEAGVTGSRDAVLAAMLADPLAGRIDFDQLTRMTDEMLDATAAWLPQFA
ncbi:MAG: family 4 glycosyl hydrolase [Acidimicrobiia bacterium]